MSKYILQKYSNFDRASFLREYNNVGNLELTNKKVRLVEVWDGKFSISKEFRKRVLVNWIRDNKAIKLLKTPGLKIFIGIINNTYYFARAINSNGTKEEYYDLRTLNPLLKKSDLALLTTAKGLLYWHKNNNFCSLCGNPSYADNLGHSRKCSKSTCGNKIFPRLDPAVIMLVTYNNKCLLGRQQNWPKGMHSTLAGFVEHGETLEQAVERETQEETGIKLKNITYKYSQPWPFPSSLMLGYIAEANKDEIKINYSELETAKWFTKEFLKASPENDLFRLPGKMSIARRLIEEWISEN